MSEQTEVTPELKPDWSAAEDECYAECVLGESEKTPQRFEGIPTIGAGEHPATVFHPANLSRFGKNPYGDPLFRIVHSDSRRVLIKGVWPDGRDEARWDAKYAFVQEGTMQLMGRWVLERWISGKEFAGGLTREQYETQFPMLGPFPDRGEYECCHVFEACPPEDANFDKLIAWIEEGRKRSFVETEQALKDKLIAEKEAKKKTEIDMLMDSFSASFGKTWRGAGDRFGNPKTKADLPLSANDLGLPTQGGAFFTPRKKTN